MPTTRKPRAGSLQFRPRKRAKRAHARVRSWATNKEAKPLGFAGIKAGMTHIMITDNRKTSPTKGHDIVQPVTIIECPPMKIAGIRFYKQSLTRYGETVAAEVHFKPDKALIRRTDWKESGEIDKIKPEEYTRATILAHSQPGMTGTGQKTPHILELGFGGKVEDAIKFVKEHKEITINDVFQPGQFIDTHSVSKGKGTQGPVKRMGIGLKSHKSEKSRRTGVLGPEGYAKVQHTAPQMGQLGYHLRTEYNKQILAVVPPEEIYIQGGLVRYGNIKNTAVLVKGSIPGTKKRLITLTKATRPNQKLSEQAMEVAYVSGRSQQGNT